MEEDADQTAYVYDDSFSIIIQMRNTIMHVHDVGYKFIVNFYSRHAGQFPAHSHAHYVVVSTGTPPIFLQCCMDVLHYIPVLSKSKRGLHGHA